MQITSLLPALSLTLAMTAYAEPPAPYHLDCGTFEVRAYQDAAQEIPGCIFDRPDGPFRSSCNVFLVIDGDRLTLIDAGNGAPRGSLLAQLRADGIDPAAITDILLTHEHPDHVGGLFLPDGHPAFPNATLHFFLPPDGRPAFPNATLRFFLPEGISAPLDFVTRAQTAGYAITTFSDPDNADLPPGFVPEPARGHTPIHVFYRKDNILFIGDTFHAVDLQVPHPEISARWDYDPAAAVQVRRTLLDRIQSTPSLRVFGAPIPFPGLLERVHFDHS